MSNSRIGIDPGITGALALVVGDRGVRVWDMPITTEGRSRGVSGALLADIVAEAVELAGERPTIILERVAARPGQGVVSMFSFGKAAGIAEGVIAALGLPIRRVTPATWKRRAKLTGKPKDAGRSLALDLFPELSSDLRRKKDGGRADALLLAHFGADGAL